MRHRQLGETGVQVSVLMLGATMFGRTEGGRGGNPDRDECVRIVHTAVVAGVNLIDTALSPTGWERAGCAASSSRRTCSFVTSSPRAADGEA